MNDIKKTNSLDIPNPQCQHYWIPSPVILKVVTMPLTTIAPTLKIKCKFCGYTKNE